MDQFFHCTSKKLLTLKNSKKYLSKLAYITLSHRFTDLSCECKNVVQTCPELTLFLPTCGFIPAVKKFMYLKGTLCISRHPASYQSFIHSVFVFSIFKVIKRHRHSPQFRPYTSDSHGRLSEKVG